MRQERVGRACISACERVLHVWLIDTSPRTLEVLRLDGGGIASWARGTVIPSSTLNRSRRTLCTLLTCGRPEAQRAPNTANSKHKSEPRNRGVLDFRGKVVAQGRNYTWTTAFTVPIEVRVA